MRLAIATLLTLFAAQSYAGLANYRTAVTGGLPPGAIVIGPGPDSLVISRDTTITGTFVVAGSGRLIVRNARLTLNGDINVFDSARVSFTGGALIFHQDYLYQRSIIAGATGAITFDHCEIRITNGNANATIGDHASWTFHAVTFPLGFFTMGAGGNATLNVDSCPVSGEYLFTQSSRSTFSNSALIIAWSWISSGQIVDVRFPEAVAGTWAFPDSAKTATGVSYRASFTNCANVLWTVIHASGASLTVHDSHLRAIGLVYNGADSIALTGIANGAHYADDVFPDTTRTLHLINTSVDTWNYYPFDRTRLSLTNCLFGELLASGFSAAYVNTSVCDGSGGYFSATDSASVSIVSSQFKCPVIARMRSKLTFIGCQIDQWVGGDQITTERAGSIALLNTRFTGAPKAFDTSLVLAIGALPPTSIGPGSTIDLQGSAAMVAGPLSPVKFVAYSVSAGPGSSGPWTALVPRSTTPVVSGTLARWHVPSSASGLWAVRVTLTHNFGDSLTVSAGTMVDPSLAGIAESPVTPAFAAYPNPTTRFLTAIAPFGAGTTTIELFDLRGTLLDRIVTPGGTSQTFDLDRYVPGTYMMTMTAAGRTIAREIVKN